MSDNDWMVECVTQFLSSPLWTVPMHNFIDDNCIFFGGSDSDAVQREGLSCDLFILHKNFCTLIDGLLTNFITELGVPGEDLIKVMQDSPNPDAAKFFEYLMALDDFTSFKQIMIKRNLELEQQAMASLARAVMDGPEASPEGQQQVDGEEPLSPLFQEDPSFKEAMLQSLQDDMRRTGNQIDDEELKKALALSLAVDERRAAMEQTEQEELMMALEISRKEAEEAARKAQEQQDAQSQADAAQKEQQRQEHERQAAEKEAQRAQQEAVAAERKRLLEEETVQRRLELARKAAEEEKIAEQQKAEKRAQQQNSQPVAEPVVIRRQNDDSPSKSSRPGGLAPIGRPGLPPLQGGLGAATFGGFNKLGAIPTKQPNNNPMEDKLANQPTFSQLVAHAQAEKGEQPAVVTEKPGPSEEEQKKFAAYMRAQRDKILKANKQQRANEMNGYKESQGVAPSEPSQPGQPSATIDQDHAQLSIELARRMRAGLGTA